MWEGESGTSQFHLSFEKKHIGSAVSEILQHRQTDRHTQILLLLYKDYITKSYFPSFFYCRWLWLKEKSLEVFIKTIPSMTNLRQLTVPYIATDDLLSAIGR